MKSRLKRIGTRQNRIVEFAQSPTIKDLMKPSFYNKVMEEMGRAMYFNFKNGK